MLEFEFFFPIYKYQFQCQASLEVNIESEACQLKICLQLNIFLGQTENFYSNLYCLR